MPKQITRDQWISHLELLCFTEHSEKRPNGVRRYAHEDCKEGTELFEKWLNQQSVDKLIRQCQKLEI